MHLGILHHNFFYVFTIVAALNLLCYLVFIIFGRINDLKHNYSSFHIVIVSKS